MHRRKFRRRQVSRLILSLLAVSVLVLLEVADLKFARKLNSTRLNNALRKSAKKAFKEMEINTKTATSSINERFSGVSLAFLSRTREQEFVKNRPKNPVDGLQ